LFSFLSREILPIRGPRSRSGRLGGGGATTTRANHTRRELAAEEREEARGEQGGEIHGCEATQYEERRVVLFTTHCFGTFGVRGENHKWYVPTKKSIIERLVELQRHVQTVQAELSAEDVGRLLLLTFAYLC
jgi:hypothetical protein